MWSSMTASCIPGDPNNLNGHRVFCKNWATVLTSVLFNVFRLLLRLFMPTSSLVMKITCKWGLASNGAITLISYGIFFFACLLSSVVYKGQSSFIRATVRFLSQNNKKMVPEFGVFHCICTHSQWSCDIQSISTVRSLQSTILLILRYWNSLNTDGLCDTATSISSMRYFAAETVGVSTHFNKASQKAQGRWTWL